MMIQHIVMFKFKEEANGKSKQENLLEAKERMLKLKDEIKQVVSLEVYFNDEQAVKDNYDYILVSTFQTMEDLNQYQVHPSHVAFGQYITPLRESRVCIDYKIED
ncbi:MAG: Dabb family protein [Beduini sp.]|uniref:Dabb family protein n=1 Tax=Beduini sp. TaxID=1922300 RepID=UPI00399081C5